MSTPVEKKSLSTFAELRKATGKTQLDMASLMCVSRQTWCNWENGNTHPQLNYERQKKLARLLNIDFDTLWNVVLNNWHLDPSKTTEG